MHKELESLIFEYGDATTPKDRLIRRKLQSIGALFEECGAGELVFAEEICAEFCRVFRLLEEKYQWDEAETPCHPKYPDGESLLNGFYNYFKKPYQIDYCRIGSYPFRNGEEWREKVNVTLRDYVARIKTFARRYLPELVEQGVVPSCEVGDPILFVYAHLVQILGNFDTKENGIPNKQRQNIRSALRKLYDFQCAEEELA